MGKHPSLPFSHWENFIVHPNSSCLKSQPNVFATSSPFFGEVRREVEIVIDAQRGTLGERCTFFLLSLFFFSFPFFFFNSYDGGIASSLLEVEVANFTSKSVFGEESGPNR